MRLPRLFAAAALVALLAACNGDSPEEGEATGEVLEGTISDDMLPVDEVQSEAPLADRTGSGTSAASSVTSVNAEERAEAPAAEAPAEETDEAAD